MDLALAFSVESDTCDFVQLANGDLALDDGLYTAVLVSLLTDAAALPDDVIPDRTTNRRGTWMDIPLASASISKTKRPLGSRLWQLDRAKATQETRLRAQEYATEALQWMIDDNLCQKITAVATFLTYNQIVLSVTLTRQIVGGQPVSTTYDRVWTATLAA